MEGERLGSPLLLLMKKKGLFITFEGIDGSGKTTQLRLTEKFLRQTGRPLLVLREPGSTPVSEKIREILLDRKSRLSPETELLLYEAARSTLVRDIIAPALKNGLIVLCDRFYDSTTAYQGYGRGLDLSLIDRLNKLAVGKCHPDLTFLVDVNYKTSLTRRKKNSDRLESESAAFFRRVRNGFLAIARKEQKRVVLLRGDGSAAETFAEVINCLQSRLKIR